MVKTTDPLRGEPVCLYLTSCFLFFLLAHVVSLPLLALRLWWVREVKFQLLCFTISLMGFVSNSLMVLIVAKHFDLLRVMFSYPCLQKFGMSMHTDAQTHAHTNISHCSPVFPNVLTNTRKINSFLWMLSVFTQRIDDSRARGFFSD